MNDFQFGLMCISLYACIKAICDMLGKFALNRKTVMNADEVRLSSENLEISGIIDYADDMIGLIEDGHYYIETDIGRLPSGYVILRGWSNSAYFIENTSSVSELLVIPVNRVCVMHLVDENQCSLNYEQFKNKYLED